MIVTQTVMYAALYAFVAVVQVAACIIHIRNYQSLKFICLLSILILLQ